MKYLTVKEFASLHQVSTQAIFTAVRAGNLKSKISYGLILLNAEQEYSPVRGRGKKKKVESLDYLIIE